MNLREVRKSCNEFWVWVDQDWMQMNNYYLESDLAPLDDCPAVAIEKPPPHEGN